MYDTRVKIEIDPEFTKQLNHIMDIVKGNLNPSFNPKYPKLVRDKIPEIIIANNPAGTSVKYRKLTDDEYKQELINKLVEEVLEYVESDDVVELADILEVVYALGKIHGETETTLGNIRNYKAFTNGRFEDRIYLEEVHIGNKYEDAKDKLEESED